jgi:hypothetical protein
VPQGIGFGSARALTRAGHAVHATVRNHANDAALTDGFSETLHVHHLELRDRDEARAVIAAVAASEGRLDVLVNNAGYGVIGGIEQVDIEVVRENSETNFVGTRLSGDADPRPTLSDELYAWVQSAGPEPQSPQQVADALVGLVGVDDPPLAAQSGLASERYVAAALRDPSRQSELDALLAAFAQASTGQTTETRAPRS